MDYVRRGDARYPSSLNDLPTPPDPLWGIGDWSITAGTLVAIVGTRRMTAYGERVAHEIAGALARAGACIVSGMARGIDGTAHRAALEAKGKTIAVLGTGVDVAYPVGHRALHREIGEKGLLLSELKPGAHSHGGSFPQRNRIIAALATTTIVIEAPIESGALITADHALKLNRTVAVVPGPIDSPQSQGSNLWLRDGAAIITSVEDAVTLVGLEPAARGARAIETEAEASVWSVLADGAATMDALCARSRLPVNECMAAVTALELRGAVECALTGEIRRR